MHRTLRLLVILVISAGGLFPVRAQSPSQETVPTQTADPFSRVHADLARSVDDLLAKTAQTEPRWAPEPSLSEETRHVVPTERWERRHGSHPALNRFAQLRPQLEPILQREGIPLDLALVVVIESAAKTDALSPKGARGLWQLIPDTARRYGLVVEEGRDDRLDVEKSTRAAAQYLRDLYTQFQSWPLALAAYNAGGQAVQRAVDAAPSREFAVLSARGLLPAETRNYVPAVIGLIGRSGLPSHLADETRMPPKERVVYAGLTN